MYINYNQIPLLIFIQFGLTPSLSIGLIKLIFIQFFFIQLLIKLDFNELTLSLIIPYQLKLHSID